MPLRETEGSWSRCVASTTTPEGSCKNRTRGWSGGRSRGGGGGGDAVGTGAPALRVGKSTRARPYEARLTWRGAGTTTGVGWQHIQRQRGRAVVKGKEKRVRNANRNEASQEHSPAAWSRHGQDTGHRSGIEQCLAVGGGWWLVAVGGWRLVVVGGGWQSAVGGWRLAAVGGGGRLVAVGGRWRLVVGSWRLVMVGGWRLEVGWRLAVGGWRLVAVGGWRRFAAVSGGGRLAVVGSWRLVAVGG